MGEAVDRHCLMAGPTLLLAPAFAILEGCGAVAEVARVRMGQIVAGHLADGGRCWPGDGLCRPPLQTRQRLIVGLLWIGINGAILCRPDSIHR